jgi:hypothetical protein
MRYRLTLFIIAFAATSAGAHAAGLGGALSANAAGARDHPLVFAAKWRHSSSAAILTCNKIFNRSEREKCLGNMQHPHGVPPKR